MPVPQDQFKPIFVTVLYTNQQPRQVSDIDLIVSVWFILILLLHKYNRPVASTVWPETNNTDTLFNNGVLV